ncbi:hypothetical protein MBANPS3_008465 [Mucor bainieri]
MKLFTSLLLFTLSFKTLCAAPLNSSSKGTIRHFYIAAQEELWDYAPMHWDNVRDQPLTKAPSSLYTTYRKDKRIGSVYHKAFYRQYRDDSFSNPIAHDTVLGNVGPIIRAEAGDQIHITFYNKASYPHSIHPHTENADAMDLPGQFVQPGDKYRYVWDIPADYVFPENQSSVIWSYSSKASPVGDVNAGLLGLVVIYKAGTLEFPSPGSMFQRPKGIDQEVFTLMTNTDESKSTYYAESGARLGFSVDRLKELEATDPLFRESNRMYHINGYVYNNNKVIDIVYGSRVRWYVISFGVSDEDVHTAHWHGATMLHHGHRVDVVDLTPISFQVVDMIPDNVVDKKPKLDHDTDSGATTTPMEVDPPQAAVAEPVVTAALNTPTSKPALAKPKLTDQEKQALHQRFAQKFGSMDKERSLKRQRVEQLMTDIDKQRDEIIPHQKFTPLETQVVELKAKYPGCLLLIEVGYKFRFFGEDAKIASRVLHIANFIDRNFYVASVPVHRLNYHVQKLVKAGYRVGIVRQTETAALKAVGSNRGQPFQRELQQMITKGTMVDDMTSPQSGGYLMCLVEEKRGGHGSDERVYTGMVAVQPATGDIIYDTFEDTYMRSELETRLLHIEPSELLLPGMLSKPTEKLVKHLSLQKSTSFGEESIRIERMPSDDTFCGDYNAALTFVSDFYASTPSLPQVVELPDIVIKTLACIIRYLDEFNLTNTLKSTKFFKHFVSASHMLLNGNTLVNLEIYRNNTDFTEKGSLFSILNHTSTKFGQRLLRKWVGRPLVSIDRLNERINAIEELITSDNPKKNLASSLLSKLPDIEKGLCRIHYGKSSPKELIQVLDALIRVSTAFLKAHEPRFSSDLLNRLFDTLPTINDTVVEFREAINPGFNGDDKVDLFKSEERWPEIPKQKKNIKYVETLLADQLEELKTTTRMADLKYVTVAGIEYLMEVPNSKTKKVPSDWIKISGTKAVSRYHNKYIIDQLKEREQYRELLALSAETAYKSFLSEISEKYEQFRDVVSSVAHLDCLLSLSITASQSDYVKPVFHTDEQETEIKVVDGRHPIVERLSSTYVPNDIDFSGSQKAMILTGPNMGGKSSYIRQIALISIMGQIGSYVPAKSATLSILDAVYTRMGASDNMMRGESTFMVELHETSDIMKYATSKSLVILDELGRGTSTHDGQAIAYAVLKHFVQEIKSVTLFVTHYPSLGKLVKTFPGQVRNCYMSYMQEEGDSDFANIVFLYKLVDGIAMNSYGMNVARLANIPLSVIKVAKQKSDEMKKEMEERQFQNRRLQILKSIMQPTYDAKQIQHELSLL